MNRLFSLFFVYLCYCTPLFAGGDSTFVVFPPDYTLTSNGNDIIFGDPKVSGKPIVTYSYGCVNPIISYKDSLVNQGTSFSYCKHIVRTWTVKSTCTKQNDVKTKKQHLYLNDVEVPTFINTPQVDVSYSSAKKFLLKLNPINVKDVSGIHRVEIQLLNLTGIYPQTKYSLPATMEIDSIFAGKIANLKYIVMDSCGNYKVNEVEVYLPLKKLQINCKYEVVKEISNSGEVVIDAKEFLSEISENFQTTSDASLKFGKELKNPCSSKFLFPIKKLSDTIKCTGIYDIQLWAKSKTGLEVLCRSVLTIKNTNKIPNIPSCLVSKSDSIDVCIEIKSAKGQPINAKVDFEFQEVKSNNGNYCLRTSECIQNYWLYFDKNNNPTNGVTTLDLVLMSKHILGVQPITTQSGLLAADVNKDGKISTADLVELRKVILGLKPNFIDLQTWRFYDENYQPKPMIMLSEYKSINKKIIAVKTGDVDESAIPD